MFNRKTFLLYIAFLFSAVFKCDLYAKDPCGFESSSLCGFESDVTDDSLWVRVDGNSGHVDHTYRAEFGKLKSV